MGFERDVGAKREVQAGDTQADQDKLAELVEWSEKGAEHNQGEAQGLGPGHRKREGVSEDNEGGEGSTREASHEEEGG